MEPEKEGHGDRKMQPWRSRRVGCRPEGRRAFSLAPSVFRARIGFCPLCQAANLMLINHVTDHNREPLKPFLRDPLRDETGNSGQGATRLWVASAAEPTMQNGHARFRGQILHS